MTGPGRNSLVDELSAYGIGDVVADSRNRGANSLDYWSQKAARVAGVDEPPARLTIPATLLGFRAAKSSASAAPNERATTKTFLRPPPARSKPASTARDPSARVVFNSCHVVPWPGSRTSDNGDAAVGEVLAQAPEALGAARKAVDEQAPVGPRPSSNSSAPARIRRPGAPGRS
jgi:hypothetical protein